MAVLGYNSSTFPLSALTVLFSAILAPNYDFTPKRTNLQSISNSEELID
jgi:hypothetical protein